MKNAGCLPHHSSLLQRRAFLRVGSLSVLGISLSQYLRAGAAFKAKGVRPGGKAQACILVWLEGGPSQVDTWDPKSNSNFNPIPTNVDGIQVSELLPRTARHMDKLAVIRSMRSEENNHPEATYEALTGHRPTAAMKFPSLGSIITYEKGQRGQIPPHLLLPAWTGTRYEEYFKGAFLGSEYDAMVLPDPNRQDFQIQDLVLPKSLTPQRLENRRSLQRIVEEIYRRKVHLAEHASMDQFTSEALAMILTPEVRQAFDLSQEPDRVRDAYGRNSFGQSLLLARRLVEAGSRFITAAGHEFNRWDAHQDNDERHRKMTAGLDGSLPVLLEDLDQRGLLESTLVVVMGEFGRTAELNTKYGRDHWPHCWSMALGGGGIRGGQVVGASDDRGAYVVEREVTLGDLFATIFKAFGIDWHKEYMTPVGRPVKIANSIDDITGEPLAELI